MTRWLKFRSSDEGVKEEFIISYISGNKEDSKSLRNLVPSTDQ